MPTLPPDTGVTFTEIQGSPRERWEGLIFRATQELVCAWDDRLALANYLLNTANYGVGYYYPPAYAMSPQILASCRGVGIQPYKGHQALLTKEDDAPADWASWEKAHLTVEYRTPGTDDPLVVGGEGEEQAISETLEGFTEGIVLPYKDYQWTTTPGTPIEPDEAPVKLIHGYDYTVTHHGVDNDDIENGYGTLALAISLVGKVNSSTVLAKILPGMSWEAEQVLCKDPVVQRGDTKSNIIYRFGIRTTGWNKYWRGDTMTWERIYLVGTSTQYNSYPVVSFSGL